MPTDVNPKISVLLPIYNGEAYLKEAVESVLAQTYENFELLACIDGTKDGSEDILRSFGDDRLKIYSNSVNMGLGRTLNKLVYLADPKSEYLAIAEQDDIYYMDRFESQIQAFNSDAKIGLVSGIADFFDGVKITGRFPGILVNGGEYPEGVEMFLLNYIYQTKVVNSCMMIKKRVHVDNGLYFSMHYPSISVDWAYLLRFSLVSKIYGLNKSLVKLRRSLDHIHLTKDANRRFRAARELIRAFKNEYPDIVSEGVYKRSMTTQHIIEIKATKKYQLLLKFFSCFVQNSFDDRWWELVLYYLNKLKKT